MLNRNIPISLYIQLADAMKRKIEQGFYEVNSKIPSEKELMKNYSVGRATVREAIKILVSEGYLEKKQGIGTFVKIKNQNLGFEPLISLAYLFKGRGYNYFNRVIEKGIIDILKENDFRWNYDKAFYI
ncbi:GntR family transcriptional regulator, partial [Clostridiaceae bacterium HSG29]|nr:GntR family transcriptional regulator [Clostridiaceae bacterium HSG29]